VKLDVPTDAFLPTDYVTKEELRLEAYRRLAGGHHRRRGRRHPRRVGGPLRPGARPAEALLDVGSLRAECNRLGLRDVQIVGHQAASARSI
jgi:transcription-repair coupling factor (superfamily II helicase)